MAQVESKFKHIKESQIFSVLKEIYDNTINNKTYSVVETLRKHKVHTVLLKILRTQGMVEKKGKMFLWKTEIIPNVLMAVKLYEVYRSTRNELQKKYMQQRFPSAKNKQITHTAKLAEEFVSKKSTSEEIFNIVLERKNQELEEIQKKNYLSPVEKFQESQRIIKETSNMQTVIFRVNTGS